MVASNSMGSRLNRSRDNADAEMGAFRGSRASMASAMVGNESCGSRRLTRVFDDIQVPRDGIPAGMHAA